MSGRAGGAASPVRGPRDRLRLRFGQAGQMTVELAVTLPVVVVVALVIYNLGRFVQLCAAFDQVSLDAMVSQGVSPPGEQSELSATGAIRSVVRAALPGNDFDVQVSAAGGWDGDGSGLTLAPHLVRYRCVLEYRPWPRSLVIAGVRMGTPLRLRHERTLVVDRFRSGVVF